MSETNTKTETTLEAPPTEPSKPGETKPAPENDKEYLSQLRQEAAASRVEAKAAKEAADKIAKEQEEFKASIAAAFGIKKEETDPVKLNATISEMSTKISEATEKATQAETAIKKAQLDAQVAILAHSLGGNAELLLANKDFQDSIAEVDPSDKAAIQAAITKAIQANAALKAVPNHSGNGENHTGPTVQTLETQLKEAEEKKDLNLIISLKRRIAALKNKQ